MIFYKYCHIATTACNNLDVTLITPGSFKACQPKQ